MRIPWALVGPKSKTLPLCVFAMLKTPKSELLLAQNSVVFRVPLYLNKPMIRSYLEVRKLAPCVLLALAAWFQGMHAHRASMVST